jgi:hypothetical protein
MKLAMAQMSMSDSICWCWTYRWNRRHRNGKSARGSAFANLGVMAVNARDVFRWEKPFSPRRSHRTASLKLALDNRGGTDYDV